MVKIGDKTVENASVHYQSGAIVIRFPSKLPYSTLEELYGDATTIEVISGSADELYYVINLVGMSRSDGVANLTFSITTIGPDIADELRGDAEDADAALVELAEMVVGNAEQISEIWEYLHEKFPEEPVVETVEEANENG